MSPKIIRKNQVMLRFSDAEFEQIKHLHDSHGPLAVALRNHALNRESVVRQSYVRAHFAPIDPAFIRQIAGAMSNINQIAKLANTYRNDIEKLQIVAALANLENQLNQLLEIGYSLSEIKQ
jgi:hypothetical protein